MEGLDKPKDEARPTASLLRRALRRARGSLLWERMWPALASLVTAFGLFLAFSWAGLWLALPPLARVVALVLFVVFALVAALPLLWVRLPSVTDGLRRLDRGSGEAHRPATAVADEIAANRNDPLSQALWQAHIERSLAAARKLRAGWPTPRLSRFDPMAFRALTLILVFATFFAASGERIKRITAAFDWQGIVSIANFRIDAWVTPPVYTGRAPVMLPGIRPGEVAQAGAAVTVPVGSELIVRSTGNVRFEIVRKGSLEDAPASPSPLPSGTEERRFVIKGDGAAVIHGASRDDLTWRFTAVADAAPKITLLKDPERQARGAMRLDYRVEDDYGVVEARATFARKEDGPSEKAARPLFEAPSFPLVLPQARTRAGAAQTTHDLSEHAWAGAEVVMTLVARDEAGNEGRSDPHEFVLPQRLFTKPVARALIEQRRVLALDADAKPLVAAALEALTLAPERFTPEIGVYLGLRAIYFQLMSARSDEALRDVVARMWQMAVQIEDGNVSDAEQRLRQAQENLRQALDRNASEEEIKKLMDELRAALDKFMQALMEELRKNPQQLARPLDRNSRTMTPQDLKNMLDRLENLARSGNKDAARQLLEQLQAMLENLQTARPGASQDGDDDDDMMSALDELGDMIRKQQQLRDKTFREGQDSKRDRQRGRNGENQMGDLRQDQQGLRERLNKLLEQLRQRGMGNQQQGDKGEKGKGEKGQRGQGQGGEMDQLGDAEEAMGDAEGQLGDGNAEGAVDSQGRALEALRKGAQGMAQAMQQQGQMGPGPNGRPGRGQSRAQNDTDPLGRPLRGRDYGDDVTVKVPGEIDAQRARRILEELRRRFADPARPQLELDYLERLLKDF